MYPVARLEEATSPARRPAVAALTMRPAIRAISLDLRSQAGSADTPNATLVAQEIPAAGGTRPGMPQGNYPFRRVPCRLRGHAIARTVHPQSY